jgi:hypothetical protein
VYAFQSATQLGASTSQQINVNADHIRTKAEIHTLILRNAVLVVEAKSPISTSPRVASFQK